MRRYLPVLAALLSITGLPRDASAQLGSEPPGAPRQASPIGSRVIGFVTDETGAGIEGVSVLALGSTLLMARTDLDGKFSLALPSGSYVLRAALDGYISTYREAVEVERNIQIRRHITLLRAGPVRPDVMLLASTSSREQDPEPSLDPELEAGERTPSETAWRLRHLPRTVLRDEAIAAVADAEPRASIFSADSILARPARAAAAFLADSDLEGHVDFLTTSSLAGSGQPSPVDWPRGVAYVVIGAPVGRHGDWAVRAAMTGGNSSSWTFLGEYEARANQTHAFRTGVAYSALTPSDDSLAVASTDASRRVGGVYGYDQWTVRPGLQLDYGMSLDRYDYLAEPNLVSGTFGVRQRVAPRTSIVVIASPRMVAPGAEQFLPPSSSGAWLPPERTFSPLRPGGSLRPARIERYDVGAETVLTGDRRADDVSGALTLRVRRFSERTSDQIATIFGLDEASQVGHYYISSPGDVTVDGWVFGVTGQLFENVHGTVDYAATRAEWTGGRDSWDLGLTARSLARGGIERNHDLTTSVEATVPASATRVSVAWRVNSGFSRQAVDDPGLGGRFAIEVRQQLPVRPLGRGELNLLVSARTLLHEIGRPGAYYDELLTLAPPLRLSCGLQMRF